jgi:hypothetical protein
MCRIWATKDVNVQLKAAVLLKKLQQPIAKPTRYMESFDDR